MKIYGMYGWDFPSSGVGGPSGFNTVATPILNTPFQAMALGNDTTINWGVDATGWFNYSTYRNGTNTGGPYRHRVGMDLKAIVPNLAPTSNIFVGYRFKITGAVYADSSVANLSSYVDGNVISLFLLTDLPAYALGKTYYLEYQLDFANSIINRRINGLPLTSIAMPAWMLTAVSATPGVNSVWHNLGGSAGYYITNGDSHTLSFKDMYVIEWEAGEKVQALGDLIVAKLTVSAVDAPTWVPSTGTPTSVLKTGYSNPSTPVGAPTITTDDAMIPASITYDASSIPLNAVVRGVAVKGRSAVTVAATGNLGIALTVGANTTADANTAMVAAQTFYEKLYSSDKSPSGQAWTQPNLAALSVKVKPKV